MCTPEEKPLFMSKQEGQCVRVESTNEDDTPDGVFMKSFVENSCVIFLRRTGKKTHCAAAAARPQMFCPLPAFCPLVLIMRYVLFSFSPASAPFLCVPIPLLKMDPRHFPRAITWFSCRPSVMRPQAPRSPLLQHCV